MDVKITGGRIERIGASLCHSSGDSHIDAGGGALLPGLHDHHIHMVALAASLVSLQCGPPAVASELQLASLLSRKNNRSGSRWIRGIGYHPSVAGDIDRDWLDQYIPDRPIRIQHRGGRLWVLNSQALAELQVSPEDFPSGLEQVDGRFSGRLYEGDVWLRNRLKSRLPNLKRASRLLASYGITGITDTTPSNGSAEWNYFRGSQERGELLQSVRMMGSPDIAQCRDTDSLQRGELKIHLLDSNLPHPDSMRQAIEAAHSEGRAVAVHCVTLTELVFCLSALRDAGSLPGDRIEHASVCPPEQLREVHELGLRVVTQPHFINERGDQYLAEVDARDLPWLYRCAGILAQGVPVAAGSDAPFGSPDPWRAMRAAVERTTASSAVLSPGEAISPDQALGLFLSPSREPGAGAVALAEGSRADLCLLHKPWQQARHNLRQELVRATWKAGELIYQSD
ncbi:MAG: amidohydrolase family protein [Halieaceae bacterium]|nr:amidohydrolase family protein [Halieaceae bacterium]